MPQDTPDPMKTPVRATDTGSTNTTDDGDIFGGKGLFGWAYDKFTNALFGSDSSEKTEGDDSGTKTPKNNYDTKTCKLVVTYNANGATGNPPSSFSQTYSGKLQPVSMQTEVKDNDTGMSKGEGYYFLGWATTRYGTVAYDPGDVIKKEWDATHGGIQSYELYAVWTNHSIFIYKPDEHSKETRYKYSEKPLNEQTHIKGETFHRTGYTQVGWATTEGGSKVYDLGQAYTSTSDQVVTLFPVWLVNTYTVTYHPNGGTGSNTTVSIDYGDELETPIDIFTKDGYHINVWNEKSNGLSTSWIAGAIYTFSVESNVDLYAIWAGDEYHVIYDDGTYQEQELTVSGDVFSSLLIDENGYLYSDYLRKTDDDILYLVNPGYAYLDVADETAPYSIATYGSPFYTDRRPYPDDKEYCSFDGWESDDGQIWTKQNAWYDAYSYDSDPTWRIQHDVVIKPRWNANYPYGKIFFDTGFSDDFGIVVEQPPSYYWPEHKFEHKQVHGKNGDILKDPDRLENLTKKYKIAAYDGVNFYSVASKVSEWLHRGYTKGYVRLEDSYEPDVYMMAVYEESNNLENVLATAGKCEISFNCMPQKFLVSGDNRIDILYSGKRITNPTSYTAYPIVIFNGYGMITINGIEIEVINNYNTIYLDGESLDAVDVGGRNVNPCISVLDKVYLSPGKNIITYDDTIYNLSIIPRWWKL